MVSTDLTYQEKHLAFHQKIERVAFWLDHNKETT
jgi:hypothetical protein